MGKKFVIMEVEKQHVAGDGTTKYYPEDQKFGECLWLHPDRIIDSSRLRYGTPQEGNLYLAPNLGGFACARIDMPWDRLILDPEPKPEQSEWDQWVKTKPAISHRTLEHGYYNVNDMDDWLKRIPR